MTETVTEPAKMAAKAFILTAKMKVLLAFFSLLLVGGGLYVLADPAGQSIVTAKDPYTIDIQNRENIINNAVLGVIDAQKTQPAYKFQTTCEDALFIIRNQNLEAEQENLKLTPDQRALNVKYQTYLSEAANVVIIFKDGGKPDLTKMNAAKAALS
jgi:hypothetical protein